jgi:PleD family two-component response regulator
MKEKEKLLIVDDMTENIDVLVALLKDEYMIAAARNGKRAVELAEKNLPDLIMLDIVMPDMDGYTVCRKLKALEITKNIPIIFITAVSEAMDEAKSFRLGAVDYITKPFSPLTVKARVKTHLALKTSQNKLAQKNAALVHEIEQRKKAEAEQTRLIGQLQEALAQVKQLSGLLPICANCKKIRDDDGYWNQVDDYIGCYSDVKFSHGICPDCVKKLYPDMADKRLRPD